MNNKSVAITVTVIVLAAIGVTVWGSNSLTEDNQLRQATSSNSTTTTEQRDGWSSTTQANVRFNHPSDASVTTENNRAKVQILGAGNQPNSEVTDGITGYLYSVEISSQNLAATAQSLFSQRSSTAQAVLASTSEDTFAGKEAYSFRLQNQLGSETQYFVLPSEQPGNALVASFTASGPEADDFSNQFEEITETAQVTEASKQDSRQEADNNKSTTTSDGTESGLSNAQACQDAGGRWLAEHNECEGVQRSWCEDYGGAYNSCASACRHNPDADLSCTHQCVQVCSLGR